MPRLPIEVEPLRVEHTFSKFEIHVRGITYFPMGAPDGITPHPVSVRNGPETSSFVVRAPYREGQNVLVIEACEGSSFLFEGQVYDQLTFHSPRGDGILGYELEGGRLMS